MSTAISNPSIIAKYRKLLQLIRRLPQPLQTKELEQARNAFRDNASVSSQAEVDLLTSQLDDKLRYLRIVTPKRPGDVGDIDEASTVYVVRDGRLEASSGRRERRVADGRISMSEARERHETLLRRQHFGRKPPSYDPSKF